MQQYHISQKIIHWLMALIIISLIAVGYIMQELPDNIKFKIYGIHKSFGVIILALIFIRIFLRLYHKRPPYPEEITKFYATISRIVQYTLYILMLIMPISGYLMSNAKGYPVALFGLKLPFIIAKNKEIADLATNIHEISSKLLIISITLHIMGTIKHHLDGIKLLSRIT